MNDVYAESFLKSVQNTTSCEGLQELSDRLVKYQTDMLSSITDQLAVLEPLTEVPSADISAIIEYLESLVAFFVGPYDALVLKQAEAIAFVAMMAGEITSKISDLGCDFSTGVE